MALRIPQSVYVEYDQEEAPIIYVNNQELKDAAAQADEEIVVYEYALVRQRRARIDHVFVLEAD
jgi:hypothetical protein